METWRQWKMSCFKNRGKLMVVNLAFYLPCTNSSLTSIVQTLISKRIFNLENFACTV